MKKAKSLKSQLSEVPQSPSVRQPEPHREWRVTFPVTVAIAIIIFLTIYLLRLDRIAGLLQDDGWYILLAKALASGQGYTLINSPSPGIPPLYPPGFPWLLSLVFKISPQFPANVLLLKAVSVLAMCGVGWVTYHYFVRYRELPWGIALGIATTTVLAPPYVFLATSTVMSECVFTLLQLLTIVVIERCARLKGKAQIWYVIGGAVLASATFLTRSMALSLLLAIPLFLLKERLSKSLLVFCAGLILLLGPWMLYARGHTPTPTQRLEQRGYIVIGYAEQFWHKVAGAEYYDKQSWGDLPGRVWNTTTLILGREIGQITLSPLYSLIGSQQTGALSFLLSLLGIIGYIAALRERLTLVELAVPFSLGITVLWPYDPMRFVLPLAPFLIFYILQGGKTCYGFLLRKLGESESDTVWPLLGAICALFIVLHIYEHATYIHSIQQINPEASLSYPGIFEEHQELMNWVEQNIPDDAVISTENPSFVYLYTGRKTVSLENPAANWNVFEKLNIRYVVRSSSEPLGRRPTFEEARYTIVFTTKGPLSLRVIDLGLLGHRTAWGK